MFISFILTLIALIFHVTIKHYAGAYDFLAVWVQPTLYLVIVAFVVFIVFTMIAIKKKN